MSTAPVFRHAAASGSSGGLRGSAIRVRALMVKEFRHLLRDRRVLATVLMMPIVQLLLFSYAISFDVRNVPTMVVDQDHSAASGPISTPTARVGSSTSSASCPIWTPSTRSSPGPRPPR